MKKFKLLLFILNFAPEIFKFGGGNKKVGRNFCKNTAEDGDFIKQNLRIFLTKLVKLLPFTKRYERVLLTQ